MQYDVFVAYASEDTQIASSLALRLINMGMKVWYAPFALKLGDSIRRKIDDGLGNSRFGVVILSHNFFKKEWPQKELDALTAKERSGEKVILPILSNISHDEVLQYSPLLAGRFVASISDGIEYVARLIFEVVRPHSTTQDIPLEVVPLREKFLFTGKEINWIVIDGTGEPNNVFKHENIITHYDPKPVTFPADILELKKKIGEEEQAKEEKGLPACWNGPMYLLERISISRTETDEMPILKLWFRDSDYFTFLATNYDPMNRLVPNGTGKFVSLKEKYLADTDFFNPIPFMTTSFGVNVAVITSDGYLLLVERSDRVYGYRRIFDVSVVEGLRPGSDVGSNGMPDLHMCAQRGASEELGIEIQIEEVRFLSVGVKPQDNQYAILGVTKLGYDLKRVELLRSTKAAKDSWELSKILPLPIKNPESVIRFIYNNEPDSWSPNGLVCIFHALVYEFGKRSVANALMSVI